MMWCTKIDCCVLCRVLLEVWLVWVPLAFTAVAMKTPKHCKKKIKKKEMPVQQDKGRRSKQHTEKWICLSECCAPKAGLQPAGEVTGMRFCAIQSSALSSAAELAPVPFKSIQQKGEGWVILQEKSKTDQLRALVITSPLWPFHGHLSGPMGSPVPTGAGSFPKSNTDHRFFFWGIF